MLYKFQTIAWSKASKSSKIVIGKLHPEKYTFMVRSRFQHQEWGPIASYNFTIRPPWWKSWLAYLAYIVVGALLIFAFIRIRINIAVNKAKALENIRTKISTDLHDDVGSILTGIAMDTDFLAMKGESEIREDIESLGNRSRNAMEKMRDIVWAMDASKDRYENLIDRMHTYLGDIFQHSSFTYDLEVSNVIGTEFLSPDKRQHIYLIFKEAITNILKHSNGNHVAIQLTKMGAGLTLTIRDNGRSSNAIKESGQGLQNLRQRAEKMGGFLEISNEEGFMVKLSLAICR